VRDIDPLLPVGLEIGLGREEGAGGRGVARGDVHVDLGREVAELREPEAVLVHEVEGEPVAAGRDRAADLELGVDALPGCGSDVAPQAVPDDRVTAVVQPVVREIEPTPGRGAFVLHRDAGVCERTRLHIVELVGEPPHGERSGGDGMFADRLQRPD
jgi:hypothetical protein